MFLKYMYLQVFNEYYVSIIRNSSEKKRTLVTCLFENKYDIYLLKNRYI